jgi:hypothetical protein
MGQVDLDIGHGLRLGYGRDQGIAINVQRPMLVAGFRGKRYVLNWKIANLECELARLSYHVAFLTL